MYHSQNKVRKYMNLSSCAKIVYISLFIFNIPVFSAAVESKAEIPKDSFARLAGLVSKGRIENINTLINSENINLQADNGMSLLHFAVLIKDPKKRNATVQCLLSHKIAVNLVTAKSTPLDLAQFSCDDSLTEMITKAGGKKYRELEVPELLQIGVSKKELIRNFISEFEDETGISDLTNKLISSAKTEKDAIALCKEYIKNKPPKQMFKDFAYDALAAWARKTGNKKPSLMALDDRG